MGEVCSAQQLNPDNDESLTINRRIGQLWSDGIMEEKAVPMWKAKDETISADLEKLSPSSTMVGPF